MRILSKAKAIWGFERVSYLEAIGSSESVGPWALLVWCHSWMTVDPAVTAQTLEAGTPPLTLQAVSLLVTSWTGLLFGG